MYGQKLEEKTYGQLLTTRPPNLNLTLMVISHIEDNDSTRKNCSNDQKINLLNLLDKFTIISNVVVFSSAICHT